MGDITDNEYVAEKREIERKLVETEPRGDVPELVDIRSAGELLKDLGRLWDHPRGDG